MGKWYNIKNSEQQNLIWSYASGLPRKPYPAVEGIKKVMELYNYHEMRKHKPEDFYDDSFVDEQRISFRSRILAKKEFKIRDFSHRNKLSGLL